MTINSSVDAVIVLYKPDLLKLNRVLRSISDQVRTVYLVNNSSTAVLGDLDLASINVKEIVLGENCGIAVAQNVGIDRSLSNGSDFVLLSDQDTEFPRNYVARAVMNFQISSDIGVLVPAFVDLNGHTGRAPFVFKSRTGFYSKIVKSGKKLVFHAIASGMLIRSDIFNRVGKMDEKLFIDWVDLEWCWRLDVAGIKILADADLVIEHILGDTKRNIGYRSVPLRSVLRHYYITRNAFHLALRSPYLSRVHKMTLFFRSFRYLFGFPLLSSRKLLNLKFVLIGMLHGLRGRLGRYDP